MNRARAISGIALMRIRHKDVVAVGFLSRAEVIPHGGRDERIAGVPVGPPRYFCGFTSAW